MNETENKLIKGNENFNKKGDQEINKPMNEDKPINKRKNKRSLLRFEIGKEGKGVTMIDENAIGENTLLKKLCEITGIENSEVQLKIIMDGANNLLGCENEAQRCNIILQSLAEQQPNDIHEARLSAQAAVLYNQAMKYLKRTEGALDDEVFDKQGWNQIFARTAARLFDLHNKTIETLARYRQKGEQRITVVHQNVNLEGGAQAVIGNKF